MNFQRIAAMLLALGLSGWAEEPPKVSIPELLRPETRLRAFQQYRIQAEPDDAKEFAWAELREFAAGHSELKVSELKRGAETSRYLVTWERSSGDDWNAFDSTMRLAAPAPAVLVPRRIFSYQLFSADGAPLFATEKFIGNGNIADLNADGEPEVVEIHSTSFTASGELEVEYLRVQQPGLLHPSLLILLNTHPRDRAAGNTWSFQLRDTGKGGLYEIELGPATAPDGIEPKVTFRWDGTNRIWVGPESKPGDHFRVLTSSEQIAQIVKDGGLDYPLARPPKSERATPSLEAIEQWRKGKVPSAETLSSPYRYQSLEKFSHEKLFSFISVRPHAWDYISDRMREATAVLDLWTLDPQAAALAYVKRNRPSATDSRHLLSFFHPANERPPTEGDLTLSDGPSGSFAPGGAFIHHLHCARKGSYLAYVGAPHYWNHVSPLASRTQYDFRKLDLSYEQARRALQLVWWMSRIRSRALTSESIEFTSGGSTSDGYATVQLAAKGHDLTVSGMRSANHEGTFLGVGAYRESYDTSAFINLVVQLFARELPERLGQPWKAQAMSNHWNEERNAPEPQTDHELARVKVLTTNFLQLFRERKLGAGTVLEAVQAVGERGWRDLRPKVEQLATMLPPPLEHEGELAKIDAQLKEWEKKLGADASEKGFHDREHRRYAARNPDVAKTAGWKVRPITAEEDARFTEVDALYHARSRIRYRTPKPDQDIAELRRMIPWVLRQLDTFDNPEALFRWASEEPLATHFALSRLAKIDRRLAIALLHQCEQEQESEEGKRYYADARKALTAGDPANPTAAGEAPTLSATERAQLVATLRNAEAVDADREYALAALIPSEDPKRYSDPVIDAAVWELLRGDTPPPVFAPDALPLAAALRLGESAWEALIQRARRTDFAGIPRLAGTLPALNLIAQQAPDPHRAELRDMLAPELSETHGFLDATLWSIWQLDLRELKGEIERIATSGPEDYEGTFGSGGINHKQPVDQRYHRARHIAALWNEEDPLTRARLLVAFAVAEARTFSHAQNGALERLQSQLAAEKAGLTKTQMSALEKFVTWCETHAPAKLANRASPTQLTKVIAATRAALGIAP